MVFYQRIRLCGNKGDPFFLSWQSYVERRDSARRTIHWRRCGKRVGPPDRRGSLHRSSTAAGGEDPFRSKESLFIHNKKQIGELILCRNPGS